MIKRISKNRDKKFRCYNLFRDNFKPRQTLMEGEIENKTNSNVNEASGDNDVETIGINASNGDSEMISITFGGVANLTISISCFIIVMQ